MIVVKKIEYESSNFDAINAHAETAADNERQLLRLRRFKADRYWIRNIGLALLAIGLFAILLAISYAIYKKYYGLTPIIEQTTVEVVKEVPGPVQIKVITEEVPVPGPVQIKIITKEVPVPGPERVIKVPGESKIIKVPGPERIVIKPVPIQSDVDIDEFVIFNREIIRDGVIKDIVTGRRFKSVDDMHPHSQFCYAEDDQNRSLTYEIFTIKGLQPKKDGQNIPDNLRQKLLDLGEKHCKFDLSPPQSNKPHITPFPESKIPSQGAIGTGSGFYINDEGYVVTNNHVVQSCKSVWLEDNDGTEPASIIQQYPENDLAVIRVNKDTPNFAKFTNYINPVADVMALGFPRGDVLGQEIKRTKGSISSLSGVKGDAFSLQHTALIQKGNSGGPLVNNKNAVVGVNYAKFTEDDLQGIGLAIKAVNTIEFLAKEGIDFKLNESDEELEWVKVFEDAKKYTVRVICLN